MSKHSLDFQKHRLTRTINYYVPEIITSSEHYYLFRQLYWPHQIIVYCEEKIKTFRESLIFGEKFVVFTEQKTTFLEKI